MLFSEQVTQSHPLTHLNEKPGNATRVFPCVQLLGNSYLYNSIFNQRYMKRMDLTILVEKGEDGFYVGQIQEYPPVMSQGKTLDELKENLKDALTLFLEVQKEQIEKDHSKRKIVKRRLIFSQ